MALESSPGPEERADTLAPEERSRLHALVKALVLIERLCRFSITLSFTAVVVGPLLLGLVPHVVDHMLPGVIPALTRGEPLAVGALGILLLLLLSGAVLLLVVWLRFARRLNDGGAVVRRELKLMLLGSLPSLLLGIAGMWLALSIAAWAGPVQTLVLTVVCLGAVALPSAVVWVLTQMRDVLDVTLARPFAPESPAEAEWKAMHGRLVDRTLPPA